MELEDLIAKVFEQAPHLAVFPLAENDANLAFIAGRDYDLRWACCFAVEINSASDTLCMVRCQWFIQTHNVLTLDTIARVRKTCSHFPVVGKQQYARGVSVEPSDWINARLDRHQIEHGLSPMLIPRGGDVILGFVEHNVRQVLVGRNQAFLRQ